MTEKLLNKEIIYKAHNSKHNLFFAGILLCLSAIITFIIVKLFLNINFKEGIPYISALLPLTICLLVSEIHSYYSNSLFLTNDSVIIKKNKSLSEIPFEKIDYITRALKVNVHNYRTNIVFGLKNHERTLYPEPSDLKIIIEMIKKLYPNFTNEIVEKREEENKKILIVLIGIIYPFSIDYLCKQLIKMFGITIITNKMFYIPFIIINVAFCIGILPELIKIFNKSISPKTNKSNIDITL